MTEIKGRAPVSEASLLSKAEDTKLIARVLADDYVAFERIVKKYESRIYSHCLKFLRSPEDAEDVLQETFLQAYRSLASFRAEAAFSTWLYKIATNGCLMRIRKNKRVDFVSIDKPIEFDGAEIKRDVADWSHNPMLAVSNDEVKRALDELIAKLPDDKRIVLTLKDVEGFSNIEIGEMLGVSVAAVKSRLHRARLIMREELTKYFEGALKAPDNTRPKL